MQVKRRGLGEDEMGPPISAMNPSSNFWGDVGNFFIGITPELLKTGTALATEAIKGSTARKQIDAQQNIERQKQALIEKQSRLELLRSEIAAKTPSTSMLTSIVAPVAAGLLLYYFTKKRGKK